MKSIPIIAAIILFGVAFNVMAAGGVCPAVNCACDEITDSEWRNSCKAHEAVISKECAANNGKPHQYCRMHGPSGFPVALSTPGKKQASGNLLTDRDQLGMSDHRVDTAIWSLQQDLSSAIAFQGKEPAKAIQTAKLIARNSESLYVLQRDILMGWAAIKKKRTALELAKKYDAQWRGFAEKLEAASEKLFTGPASAHNGKKQNAVEYRLARQVATSLEYSAYLQAQVAMHEEAASAWKLAASATEELIAKAQHLNAPVKYVKYYRAQAAARWHRATYYWLQHKDGSSEEAEASFQSAEQVLNESPEEAVTAASSSSGQVAVKGALVN